MKTRIILASLAIWLSAAHTYSALRLNAPNFIRIDQTAGLNNGTIVDMLQDEKGFVWFATYNGLYR